MPSIACAVCRKRSQIASADWKYLLSDEKFLCSSKCVFDWVVKQKRTHPPSFMAKANRMIAPWDRDRKPVFRSHFEERFYEEAGRRGFSLEFEAWAFRVDKGTYTPDFYFPDFGCFIETKGKWGVSQKTKFRKFRTFHPWVRIAVVPWLIEEQFSVTNADLSLR